MTITVLWFAQLRERRGVDDEVVAHAATAEALYARLAEQHRLPDRRALALAVAIDDELARWDQPLAEGCRVAFLPPVSGG